MRLKDEQKKDALFQATIKIVNEIGFAASSVSKIAREASVSPATLYVYYKNKEDLLVSTYVEIKHSLSQALLDGFEPDYPIRDILKKVWFNAFEYVADHSQEFQFAEQFSNSPYSSLVDKEKVNRYFEPVILVLQRGIDQKIVKDVNFDILSAYVFHPIFILSNSRVCTSFTPDKTNIETAFTLTWDAIKL